MRVNIQIDIHPDFGDNDPRDVITSWLYAMADSDNQYIDPNTGDVLGSFWYSFDDILVEVKP